MEKRKALSAEVSLIGMGAMRFPTLPSGEIDAPAATQIIDYLYASGVNYYDTAYMYHDGKSEAFLSQALSRYPRGSYYLADKFPVWMAKDKDDVANVFAEQRRRCNTDYFDFYLLHAVDDENWQKYLDYGAYEFFTEQKRLGNIRRLGFSFHGSTAQLQKLLDCYEWDFVQLQLNYFDWAPYAREQYALVEQKGLSCIVMEPVRGGALANLSPQLNRVLEAIAPDRSVASWAIRFAASRKNVLTVLSGMTTLAQAEDNVATMQSFQPLGKEEESLLLAVAEKYRTEYAVPCTSCRYCEVCPKQIKIPELLKVYNGFALYKRENELIEGYEKIEADYNAAQCIACGACEAVCPQHISIPEKLKELSASYERVKA